MYAAHLMAGRWELMLHGNAFLQYIDEGSDRGDEQFGSINWFMAMARRSVAGGNILLRAMLSLEPITVGECGYPDLLATGEFCNDRGPLHDRQHPHDLFMELAATYEKAVTRKLAIQLYGGVAGEPAIGPVAYPHRLSAIDNPFAPISHHWQDATHISFGVITAGLFTRRWKLEGSVFNGREPDEDRYDIDLNALDSFSGRLWWLPTERWALQVSLAHLNEAEEHEPGEPRIDVARATASATYHVPVGPDGYVASTFVWGRNNEDGAPDPTNAFLLESTVNLHDKNVLFGRGEVVGKTGEELDLGNPALEDEVFTVGKLSLGYMRRFGPFGSLLPSLGASVSVNFVGDDLEPFYGENIPVGFAIFANVKPRQMKMHGAPATTAPEAPHGPMREKHPPQHEMPQQHQMQMTHPDSAHGLLSIRDVERELSADQLHFMAGQTVQQPFWRVPTLTYRLHGVKTPQASLQVNIYPTVTAADADAAKINRDGTIGKTNAQWVAPPHFFLARNIIMILLADSAQDPGLIAAVEQSVMRLGEARVGARK